MIDLMRDVLDKQLIDLNGRKMGKADGIVIELRKGEPPRLAFIEVGIVTEARRIHRRLERWAFALRRKLGESESESFRIPWSKVVLTGVDITVGLDSEKTPALALERWLRRKVIGKIPGA